MRARGNGESGRVGGVRAKGDHYWSGEGWRSEGQGGSLLEWGGLEE